jgi:hypothetical protein
MMKGKFKIVDEFRWIPKMSIPRRGCTIPKYLKPHGSKYRVFYKYFT